MRFKATIFLSLLLIFLGAYLFYFELPHEKKKEEAEAKAKRFFSFTCSEPPCAESEISGVTIRGPGGVIELEHHPDNPDTPWMVGRPVVTAANDGVASGFASQLANLQSSRVVEERPSDLKPFGLDPPQYQLVVTLKRGEERLDTEPLEVGGESLTGGEIYVRKGEGSPVYLTSSGIKQYLKKDLKGWRRQELFRFAPSDVRRIRIERPGAERDSPQREMEIVREGEGWRILKPIERPGAERRIERPGAERPIEAKGDPSAISNLLGTILNLRGEDFIDDKKEEKKTKLGAPLLTLRLTVGAVEREAAFYQVKDDPQAIYAITAPTAPIYRVPEPSFRPLTQPATAYQEKKPEEKKEGAAAPSASSPPKSKSEEAEPKK